MQRTGQVVYSASHDLRAPYIPLCKGLVELKLEDDITECKTYLDLMHESLNKQDKYIRDIIDYSRNTRKQINITEVSLNTIVQGGYFSKSVHKDSDKIK
jgi:light-regulated signal transduction histidine kinase (bacteriophytochrome)